MTITKRPTGKNAGDSASVERFISSAPDAKKAPDTKPGVMRGQRAQISHTLPPEMLAKVDELAHAKGMTRAGFINYAISELIDKS